MEGEDALPAETLTKMRMLAEEAATTVRLSAHGEAFDGPAPGHPRELTLREIGFAARLTGYAARKVTLSQEIRQGLRGPDLDADRIYRYILALKALDVELERLRAEFETDWLARARRSEIHVALGYYAGLRARYRAAINWLEAQRRALTKGQPVDALFRTYDTGDYRTLWQNWPD